MGNVTAPHIVVTGAAGYLGRAIVTAAEAQGYHVTKIIRNGTDGIVQDLSADSANTALLAQIESADAIIHAASEMSSDWGLHQRSSLPATKNICALANALNAHLVLISSITVYDFAALSIGGIVTENTPIETAPELRDGYVRAKLEQENIAAAAVPNASVLRVGAIYGKDRVMNAHLGIGAGPVLLRLARRGQIPLSHVAYTSQIAVRAAVERTSGAVNVLDTDLPDRVRFLSALGKSGWPKLIIPMPWQIFAACGAVLSFWRKRPGLLRRKVLHARMKPLGYDNTLMRTVFGDDEQPSFETLMAQALQHD
jgi:nucleoside-diphosphate-sugar epimerase